MTLVPFLTFALKTHSLGIGLDRLKIILLSIFLWNGNLLALPPVSRQLLNSVVLLSSPDRRACASGFISSDGHLVTNAHVTALLCPFDDCSQVKVRRADALGAPPGVELKIDSLSIEKTSQALDLAILAPRWKDETRKLLEPSILKIPAESSIRTQLGQEVFTLGFPRCHTLELTAGKVTDDTAVSFTASAAGAHGSSGSPVVDESFSLLGVVSQSSTLLGALGSIFFHTNFSTKASKAYFLNSLAALDEIAMAQLTAERLLAFYRDNLRNLPGSRRLVASLGFLGMAEGFKKQSLPKAVLAPLSPLLGAFEEYISSTPKILNGARPQSGTAAASAARLMVAYNLESRGVRQNILQPLDLESFNIALRAQVSDRKLIDEIVDMVSTAAASGYPGTEFYLIWIGIAGALTCLFFFGIWAYTLGIVFAEARGNFVWRVLVSILVGLLFWPLSYIIFLARAHARRQVTGFFPGAPRRGG